MDPSAVDMKTEGNDLSQPDYRKSHISAGKGDSYHRKFSESPYRRMVWDLERSILDKILEEFFANRDVKHLDFACGTGRILAHFEKRAKDSVGVDLSPSMLSVAEKNKEKSELYEADLTRNDILGTRTFNLITSFRFFPNAETELQNEVLQVLRKHLDKDGHLVINNHRNTNSLRNRIARLLGRRGFRGMTMADMERMLGRNGFAIEKVHHLCVLPFSEKHMLLPSRLLCHMESFLSKIPILRDFGEDHVIVCRHSDSDRQGPRD